MKPVSSGISNPVESLYRGLVLAFVAMCMLLVVFETAMVLEAQDAVPFVAAGRLALAGDFGSIYPSMVDFPQMAPAFVDASCPLLVNESKACEDIAVPFLSPPPMVLLSMAIGALPGSLGVLLLRSLGALCIGLGALMLWRELAARVPCVGRPLALAFLVLFPVAQNAIETGQNTPWLFACAVVGAVTLDCDEQWSGALLLGLLLAGCAVAKGSPAVLVIALVWARRWKAVSVFAALTACLVMASCLLPLSLYRDFIAFTGPFSTWVLGFAQNTSPDAALAFILSPGSSAVRVFTVVKIGFAAGVVVLAMARARPAREVWLLAWIAWFFASPINWWHYNWVAVAALVGTVGFSASTEVRGWVLAAWLSLLTLCLPLVLQASPLAIFAGALFVIGSFAAVAIHVLTGAERPSVASEQA